MLKLYVALVLMVNPINADDTRYVLRWTETKSECYSVIRRAITEVSSLPKYDGYNLQGKCIEFNY
jgi:hypothetical protein